MTSVTAKNGGADLPTFHHLNDSQSQHIFWLLEELNVDYNLELYSRLPKTHRAPSSLGLVSKLGKSPVFVSTDGRVINESSAIAAFLLKTYDISNRFETTDWIRDEILTSFVSSTLGTITSLELFLDLAHGYSPWPVSWLVGKIWSKIHDNFTGKELRKDLTWLEGELEGDWFGGNKLSRADIMISWPLDLIEYRGWIKLEDEFPKLWEWRQRVLQRPAWRRGIEKGNGYDLSIW